jgi:hypothetical protein
MTNITISVSEELHSRMKAVPEARWSEVARSAFEEKLRAYELMEAITKNSKITEKDIQEFADLINKRAWKKVKEQCG